MSFFLKKKIPDTLQNTKIEGLVKIYAMKLNMYK